MATKRADITWERYSVCALCVWWWWSSSSFAWPMASFKIWRLVKIGTKSTWRQTYRPYGHHHNASRLSVCANSSQRTETVTQIMAKIDCLCVWVSFFFLDRRSFKIHSKKIVENVIIFGSVFFWVLAIPTADWTEDISILAQVPNTQTYSHTHTCTISTSSTIIKANRFYGY